MLLNPDRFPKTLLFALLWLTSRTLFAPFEDLKPQNDNPPKVKYDFYETARSPFLESAETQALVETSAHLYVIDLDLQRLYSTSHYTTDIRDLSGEKVYVVHKISKSNSSDRQSYPAVVETLADGGSTIAAFEADGTKNILYIPKPKAGTSFEYHGEKLGTEPFIKADGISEKVRFALQFGSNEAITTRLVPYLSDSDRKKYSETGRFPTWTREEANRLRDAIRAKPSGWVTFCEKYFKWLVPKK